MSRTRPYCLTIAGYDPSGGAGIVADCKTFEQLKVQGLSVLTCNTIQTEDHFYSYNWISPDVIIAQLNTLLDRYSIHYFKIGLMPDTNLLLQVLTILHNRVKDPMIIWDPILQPSAGGNELDQQRFEKQLGEVLSKVSILTPNLPEFKKLFGTKTPQEVATSFQTIIYLKGGHAEQKGKDLFLQGEKQFSINPKVKTELEKHGTGCIFSSALTAHLARKFPLKKACLKSKQYVENRITSNPTLLAYHY